MKSILCFSSYGWRHLVTKLRNYNFQDLLCYPCSKENLQFSIPVPLFKVDTYIVNQVTGAGGKTHFVAFFPSLKVIKTSYSLYTVT